MEKKEIIFANGIYFKAPDARTKEKAEWVKGHIAIKCKDAIDFINANGTAKGEEWLNCDLKKSKGGKLYLELNTWKPSEEKVAEVKKELETSAEEINW